MYTAVLSIHFQTSACQCKSALHSALMHSGITLRWGSRRIDGEAHVAALSTQYQAVGLRAIHTLNGVVTSLRLSFHYDGSQ